MAQIGPELGQPLARPEAGPEQPIGMELLQPLRIIHVAFAARDMLGVARVDEEHLESSRLEDLEDGYPVHAGGFHRDGGDPDLLEPLCQAIEITAESAKCADRLRIAIGRDRDDMEGGADIEAGGVGVDRG
jgi:hypothetical protein